MLHNDLTPILAPFGQLLDGGLTVPAASLPVARLSGGLINDTFALGQDHILQRLHHIFRAEVNLDIAALTPVLRDAGVPVPLLVRTADGAASVAIDDPDHPLQGTWRVLTRLTGQTLHRLENETQAHNAGQMVARFHTALRDHPHSFAFSRPGAHDTDAHLEKLARALTDHKGHRLHGAVLALALELQARWTAWGRVPKLPSRIIHGDLKVSNLLFTGDDVVGVLDLDTMAQSSLDIELGDALRSWCNATTEDDPAPQFQTPVFAAAVAGYLAGAGAWLTGAERAALAPAVERICLELSARFAADALAESYFGWNPEKFATRGDHNLARARNQLGLARDVHAQMPTLQRLVAG